jgi:hypothetical protein
VPSYEQLTRLNLSLLDTAVDDWNRVANDLARLAETARTGLRARARTADWSGANAEVSRGYVDTTAQQFAYASGHASGIHRILSDYRDALRSCRQRLEAVREEAAREGLVLHPDGRLVHASDGPYSPYMMGAPDPRLQGSPGNPEVPNGQAIDQQYAAARAAAEEARVAIRARINAILAESEETDATAARALRDMAGDDRSFADNAYESLHEALRAQARRDAEAFVELASGQEELTDEDIQRMNELLATHTDDPRFAEIVATGLGAQGTLDFWSGLTSSQDVEPGTEQWDRLADLQRNLGATLGTATRVDSDGMRQWERDMVELGDEVLIDTEGYSASSVHGFQVMSSLLEHGEYDADFLTAYSAELLADERGTDPDEDDAHHLPAAGWAHTTASRLSFTAEDNPGHDPMVGLMEALGRNPEASAQVLVRSEDLLYLVQERDWPTSFHGPGVSVSDSTAGPTALGHAIEAATLGRDYDDPEAPMVRTDLGANVARQVVEFYGTNPDAVAGGGLSQSLANVAAGYMPDFQFSLTEYGTIPLPEHVVHFDRAAATDYLETVSRDPAAYATLVHAQEAATAVAIDQLVGGASPDVTNDEELVDAVEAAAEAGGTVAAIVNDSNALHGFEESEQRDEEYNSRLETGASWAQTVIGFGIDALAARYPVAGTLGEWTVEQLTGALTDVLSQDHTNEASEAASDQRMQARERTSDTAAALAAAATEANGRDDLSLRLQTAARRGTEAGYSNARGDAAAEQTTTAQTP